MPAEFAESISRVNNVVPQDTEYLKLTDDCFFTLEEGTYPYWDFPSLFLCLGSFRGNQQEGCGKEASKVWLD